jgi:hypothetical protein
MQRHCFRFTPVPLKARHDGWTPQRQRRFIEALAATKSISKACAAVGMSRMSAYKLRDHPDASELRAAWSSALRPDWGRPRAQSRRVAARLAALKAASKVYDVEEIDGGSNLKQHGQPTSSALETLQTYLALLRSQEDGLGSTRGD